MINIVKRAWADTKFNGDFFCIQTCSGYGMCQTDPKGAMHLLPADASNQAIGTALLDALSKSRLVLSEPRQGVWIHPETTFDSELYDLNLVMSRYKAWIAELMEKYGYKTKRALFKNMMGCITESELGKLEMTPSHHEKLEAWSGYGISKSDYVIIPATSTPEEVGAALRLALSRCT